MSWGAVAASYVDAAGPTTVDLLLHPFSGGNTSAVPAGTTGPVGTEWNGDAQVLSGKLRMPATGEAVYGWDINETTYTYDVDISNSSVDPGPLCRLVNGTNYFLGRTVIGGGADSASIYKRVSGGYTQLPAGTAAWAQGDTARFVVTPTSVKLYRIPLATGVPVLCATTSDATFATATGVGMRTNGGAVDFDNAHAYADVPALPSPGTSPVFYTARTPQTNGRNWSPQIRVPVVPVGSYLIAWGNGDSTTAPVSSAGTTWTLIADTTASGYQFGRLMAWARFATAADLNSTLTWTFGSDDWGDVGVLAFTGVNAGTPLDLTAVVNQSTTEPTLTTVTANDLLVHLSASVDATGGGGIDLTPDAALTNLATAELAQPHMGFLAATEIKASAGLTTARTFTSPRGLPKSILVALRPV